MEAHLGRGRRTCENAPGGPPLFRIAPDWTTAVASHQNAKGSCVTEWIEYQDYGLQVVLALDSTHGLFGRRGVRGGETLLQP